MCRLQMALYIDPRMKLDLERCRERPSVKYVLGSVKQGTKQPSALATIVDQEGKLAFYAMNESMEWIAGDAVP